MDTSDSNLAKSVSFEYELPTQTIRAHRHESGAVSYSYDIQFELDPEHVMDGKYMLSLSLTRSSDGVALAQPDHRRSMAADSSRTMQVCGSVWSEDEADPAQSGDEVEVGVRIQLTVCSAWPNPYGSLVPKPNGAFLGDDRETPRDQDSNAATGTYRWQVTVSNFSPSCPGMSTAEVFGFLTFDSTSIISGLRLDGHKLGSASCDHDEVRVWYDEQEIDWQLQ